MKSITLDDGKKVAAEPRNMEIRNISYLFDDCVSDNRKKPEVRRSQSENKRPKLGIKDRIDRKKALTTRQFEITEKLAMGLQNKEIAAAYGIRTNTVKSHLQSVYDKIDVENRIEATLWYLDFIGKLKKTTDEK
jgi:DNA-binding NarL/FixJ family response regulator